MLLRTWVVVAFSIGHECHGWWTQANTTKPLLNPYRQWLADTLPTAEAAITKVERAYEEGWEWPEWSFGLPVGDTWLDRIGSFAWLLMDTMVGVVGWAVFGTAWGNVRSGCRRMLQIAAVLLLCLGAHYIWAVCYPVVSLVLAVFMGAIWILRRLLKSVGTVFFYAQKWAGGAPEAADVEFHGPATGVTPETVTLRGFKRSGDQEKLVVVKKENRLAVFGVGSESQTIRSHGLYMQVEPDTARGDVALVRQLQQADRVHLCRHEPCSEEGGLHFSEYGVAKKFNPERFQNAQASHGARQMTGQLWEWVSGGMQTRAKKLATKVKEYASESEAEDSRPACMAHLCGWETAQGHQVLSSALCSKPGSECEWLLEGDKPVGTKTVNLCAEHTTQYLKFRGKCGCSVEGCNSFGETDNSGIRLCSKHRERPGQANSHRRSRSRSRARASTQETEPYIDEEDEVDDYENGMSSGLHRARALLQEVQEDPHLRQETSARSRKRSRGKEAAPKDWQSPGNTPKSGIQRNLARMGMLDSPGERRTTALEEFLERLSEGKPMGVTEETLQMRMSRERGQSVESFLKELIGDAEGEQERGQRGLTKFLVRWRQILKERAEEANDQKLRADSWSVVSSSPNTPMVKSEGSTPLKSESAPTPSTGSTPNVVRIGAPGVYKGDRRAGAGEGGDSPKGSDVAQIAQAIKNQTAELATLVRHQSEGGNSFPTGTLKGLGRQAEEIVFIIRACGQYQVGLGAGEHGQALANALLAAQVGSSTKLRQAGFKQKMTQRLAVGIAGGFRGVHEKHCLGASEFICYTDAELDAFASEARHSSKGSSEQRPPPPTRLDEWVARVKRQNDTWALVYGEEWREVRTSAMELLAGWHQSYPHRWPLNVIIDCWEELHWRFVEEIKAVIHAIKKESLPMTLSELRFHCLMPGPEGEAWLKMPSTFDIQRPDSWFQEEVIPRIERKQERLLWNLTWQSGRKEKQPAAGTGGVTTAGGTSPKGGGDGKPTLKALWGPKLTTEEVGRAKDRAPQDRGGNLLCWGHMSHMGCQTSSCQRSHEGLRGSFEQLDPCVQMQLLRRGGLKRMKPETKEGVNQKIKDLRAQIAKDKSEKIQDGKRKVGKNPDTVSSGVEGEGENPGTKAGGQIDGSSKVRFWDVPEEFMVDYTKDEDLATLVQGPSETWSEDVYQPRLQHEGRGGETAPEEARQLAQTAQTLAQGPVLSMLDEASDDLYAWAAARVARDPQMQFEEVMQEMATFGLGELAKEAWELLDQKGGRVKAGEKVRLDVLETKWEPGKPGRGTLVLDGNRWHHWDFQEEVPMTETTAALMKVAEPVAERRQCVSLAVSAAILWRQTGSMPTIAEAKERARALREEQLRQALEAKVTMDGLGPNEMVSAVEHELQVYVHDIVTAHHEKDFRSFAAFVVADLQDARLIVLRADCRGGLVVETVLGSSWEPGGWNVVCLIWKGHMTLVQPPADFDFEEFLDREEPVQTPAMGFSFYWHSRHEQPPTAPGRIFCRLCHQGKKAGGRDASILRRQSCLAQVATLAGGHDHQQRMQVTRQVISPESSGALVLQELFAGTGRVSDAWRRSGGIALTPVEVYSDPVHQQGYQSDYDLAKPTVQQTYLQAASDGDVSIGWVASPCTSYCDWSLQNGGSRTFDNPVGTGAGPMAFTETVGNTLSEFGALYFETLLDAGGFPICESSGRSGRYPKQWDLPCWQRILQRPDVDMVEFPMCSFGLGPIDEQGAFYHHQTAVVFPRHEPLRRALLRQCPGVGPHHRHVPLKGCRPGSSVTRCREAGAYSWEFVSTVVTVLQQSLVGGGLVPTGPHGKAGGRGDLDGEEAPSSADERGDHSETGGRLHGGDDPHAERPRGDDRLLLEGDHTEGGQLSRGDSHDDGRVLHPGDLHPGVLLHPGDLHPGVLPAHPGAAYGLHHGGPHTGALHDGGRLPHPGALHPGDLHHDGPLPHLEGLHPGGVRDGDRLPRPGDLHDLVETDHGERGLHEEESEEWELDDDEPTGIWSTPRAIPAPRDAGEAPDGGRRSRSPRRRRGRRDFWDRHAPAGLIIRRHGVPRERLYVPQELGLPIQLHQLRGVRKTVMLDRRGAKVVIEDYWRIEGEVNVGYGLWTGFTMFARIGYNFDDEDLNELLNFDFEDSDLEDGTEEGDCEESPVGLRVVTGSGGSGSQRGAGGGVQSYRAPNESSQRAAAAYIDYVQEKFENKAEHWQKLAGAGSELVKVAGGVRQAAESLWELREKRDMMNLQGVNDPDLDYILHPDHLAYLRDVRQYGMAARYSGPRCRVRAGLHPNAKKNLNQVYKQIGKDVGKHRVLVLREDTAEELVEGVIASPFEAVDKMNPDRSIAEDKRVVHDQRGVNCGTSKYFHPPALQPLHSQVARRIVWESVRCPKVPILLAKKDIAGAFRLLWVAPEDVELFAGELPWKPTEAFGEQQEGHEGVGIVVIYLVSSFGFSGSPGEWHAWGRATEEFHRAHRPPLGRRDLCRGFDCKVLVDDAVFIEPHVGLRPWISAEVFEAGVRKLLGNQAVNVDKDRIEGTFKTSQTVWGVVMETEGMKAYLPERRIQKGASLLAGPDFDFGNYDIKLKALQQFRGILTGWAAVVKGLGNELTACDRFLGGKELEGVLQPKLTGEKGHEVQKAQAWQDLWELFEVCRWLSARSEAWEELFCTGLKGMLTPLERVGLPGEWTGTSFVSSDATPTMIGAIDWRQGKVFRQHAHLVAEWAHRALEGEVTGAEADEMAIHLAEMLSFVAFACEVAEGWRQRVIVYGGDNMVVKHWLQGRKSKVRAGRLLVRVVNMIEMRYGCTILAGWWRTYHNVDADFITRCTDEEFEELVAKKGWEKVDVEKALKQALLDSEKFGPCFLSWQQGEDRRILMQLKERRSQRQMQISQPVPWERIHVLEWTTPCRRIVDFKDAAGALGALVDGTPCHGAPVVVCATVGVDPQGKKCQAVLKLSKEVGAWVTLLEGSRNVDWGVVDREVQRQDWAHYILDFVTTDHGEALARRRVGYFVGHEGPLQAGWQEAIVKVLSPVAASSKIKTPDWQSLVWERPQKFQLEPGIPRVAMLPHPIGHLWDGEERKVVHTVDGPLRWPMVEEKGSGRLESLLVFDRRGPPGHLRRLSSQEVWHLQGRSKADAERYGLGPEESVKEGTRATGVHTAANLLVGAGSIVRDYIEQKTKGKAGMARDVQGGEALAQMLMWLRRWKRGEFPRGERTRTTFIKAGGGDYEWRTIWRWAEAWWFGCLDQTGFSSDSQEEGRLAGGSKRQKRSALEIAEEVSGHLIKNLTKEVRPFTGKVKFLVEEWLEDHLTGDKAPATERAYSSAWRKWRWYAKRQGWVSEYLHHKADPVENENRVLHFLAYLGWLGASGHTLRQHLFAIKNAHKRAGAGDPTTGMHRVWILANVLERQAVRKPRRLGVTPAMLEWLGKHLVDPLENEKENTARADAFMVMAAMETAWFYMLRAKEYADSNGVDEDMVLRGCDLRFSKDGLPAGKGEANEVTLQFRKTKADQVGFGESKLLKATGHRHLCPVEALERMRQVWPARFEPKSKEAFKPLFRWASGRMLKRLEIQGLLQKAATGVGLPPERFMSHSLRIGGATALYQSTMDVELVKRMGRWSSGAVHRYLQDGGGIIPQVAQKMAGLGQSARVV